MNIPQSIVRIFLMLPNGQIGAQLRDIPGIASQGMLSTLGGGVDLGESPQQAALREMEEETCLTTNYYKMEFITNFTHQKTQKDRKILPNNHLFFARVSDCDKIEIKEGVGLVVLRKNVDFEKVNAGEGTQMAWKLLQEYLK
jgi:8-oxo-dGTP pyrophosphatase MutT (NUDIX family)